MRKPALILSFVCLTSCGATGVTIDKSQIVDFKIGETTYNQVLSELGKPTSRTVDSQGDIHLHYTRSFYSIKPESFLPYIGDHVGGMNASHNSTVLSFGSNLILTEHNLSRIKTDAAGAH